MNAAQCCSASPLCTPPFGPQALLGRVRSALQAAMAPCAALLRQPRLVWCWRPQCAGHQTMLFQQTKPNQRPHLLGPVIILWLQRPRAAAALPPRPAQPWACTTDVPPAGSQSPNLYSMERARLFFSFVKLVEQWHASPTYESNRRWRGAHDMTWDEMMCTGGRRHERACALLPTQPCVFP